MGAHDYLVTFTVSSRARVRDLWSQQVAADRQDSGGRPYAGDSTTMPGPVKFLDRRCGSEAEAHEAVLDLHEKWGNPVAVSFMLPNEPTDDDRARAAAAREALGSAEGRRSQVVGQVLGAFWGRKAKLVGCGGCGSRLSVEKLGERRASDCPLCGASLLSKGALAKVRAEEERVAEAKAAEAEARKPKASGRVGWVVGGWAAC